MSKLLNQILSRDNLLEAYKQVKANKGSTGIDGVTVETIDDDLRENWRETKKQVLERKYKPQPVLRVEILRAF
ncbi:maturase [Streptococcus sp. 121]|nr:maturase [Streptococcus sp. 121]